jgi:hypothetical protein
MPELTKNHILAKQLELINEQSSPLFRIMWLYNAAEVDRRQFDNNICAFHIGNGFILSVAHNLRSEAGILKSIDQDLFVNDVLPRLNAIQVQLFEKCYPLDYYTGKRYLNIADQADVPALAATFKQAGFDTRWLTLMQKGVCKPHLIIQFRGNQFYDDVRLSEYFNANTYFPEPAANRHTFLVELELVEAYYQEDIALYRIVNTHPDIVNRIPSIGLDFSLLSDAQDSYYCLQSSPSSELGKLLNKAQIEGFLEHFGFFQDDIGGHYTLEGLRYLIKGYFRFGSSGAPYVFYDEVSDKFKANAVQSEACPIQLSIGNVKDGNYQYVNAIASPLSIIRDRIELHLKGKL